MQQPIVNGQSVDVELFELEVYRYMLLTRLLDERMWALNRQGKGGGSRLHFRRHTASRSPHLDHCGPRIVVARAHHDPAGAATQRIDDIDQPTWTVADRAVVDYNPSQPWGIR